MNRVKSEIPVYLFCEICGEADEADRMTDDVCPECMESLKTAFRAVREKELRREFHWAVAFVMAFVAAAILWRWVR